MNALLHGTGTTCHSKSTSRARYCRQWIDPGLTLKLLHPYSWPCIGSGLCVYFWRESRTTRTRTPVGARTDKCKFRPGCNRMVSMSVCVSVSVCLCAKRGILLCYLPLPDCLGSKELPFLIIRFDQRSPAYRFQACVLQGLVWQLASCVAARPCCPPSQGRTNTRSNVVVSWE